MCLFALFLIMNYHLSFDGVSFLKCGFLVLFVDIIIPYFDVIFCKVCTDLCNNVSDSGIIT